MHLTLLRISGEVLYHRCLQACVKQDVGSVMISVSVVRHLIIMNVEINLELKMLSGNDPKNTANAGKAYLDRNWNHLCNYD